MPFEVMEVENGRHVKMWLPEGHDIEEQARNQLISVAKMPFVRDVCCMPDVHVGMGATIGSVIATERAVMPAAVGVDIGCGMVALPLNINASQLPDNLGLVRKVIEKAVPHGRTNNGQEGDLGAWGKIPKGIEKLWASELLPSYDRLLKRHPKLKHKFAANHLGTLGTGNHFIELCIDENDGVWLMLHSGSRGVGAKIGGYFIRLAKEDMRIHHINLEDKDLSYFSEGTQWFDDYLEAVGWAQDFAWTNRDVMVWNTVEALFGLAAEGKFPYPVESCEVEAINCHHNYVTREQHRGRNVLVTRKGAVQAREGTMGIIPGSMGARSFIVRGRGHKAALNSCSHGAGRIMSRTQAEKTFTVEDVIAQTEGVECHKGEGVIDEIPGSYKDIDAVMAAQTDMVEIVHTLKQVLCVKGWKK
ncbi:hypothetical protein LCGC14_1119040 [marine sediment metagenome]|uniref:3'-phosphate/5'-hydroxy nucleic acid ligase n=1 Tax=marine sediment metagenome TaxID=412755 RepID=A0A0F9M4J8_9ZZZZ